MNKNSIVTGDFSNPLSAQMYREDWPGAPDVKERHHNGEQCGGCSFFAPFNCDYGLCCHRESRHHLETVFEHFTCRVYQAEGWGPHSFTKSEEFRCRCGGMSAEEWDRVAAILEEHERRDWPNP